MVDPRFLSVLWAVSLQFDDSNVQWALVGSLGLAVRGISTEPHDIDIITDKAGAYEMERLFFRYVKRRVALRTSERIRSHFGILEIDGLSVEIMGDFRVKLPDGSWEDPPDIARHRQTVLVDDLQVPVLSLEWEYQASLKLGREEKAELIMTHVMK
jgi:hypothetical protein